MHDGAPTCLFGTERTFSAIGPHSRALYQFVLLSRSLPPHPTPTRHLKYTPYTTRTQERPAGVRLVYMRALRRVYSFFDALVPRTTAPLAACSHLGKQARALPAEHFKTDFPNSSAVIVLIPTCINRKIIPNVPKPFRSSDPHLAPSRSNFLVFTGHKINRFTYCGTNLIFILFFTGSHLVALVAVTYLKNVFPPQYGTELFGYFV